ncbi:MAG TPA: type II secretion system protein GspG, partial [Firmicutes bacterium]|nr:type II secretion system protein GspG [Bacillota bacterium]
MTGKMLRKAENGFTLLEVMAVLVLMAAIMAVVVPALFETVR